MDSRGRKAARPVPSSFWLGLSGTHVPIKFIGCGMYHALVFISYPGGGDLASQASWLR